VPPGYRTAVLRYGVAVLATGAVLAAEGAASDIFAGTVLYPFLAAVVTAALLGGIGPALLATLLSVISIIRLLPPPLRFDHQADLPQIIIFVVVAAGIALLIDRYRRLQRYAGREVALIAGAAPNLVRVAAADGRCTLCNQVWLRFTGRTLDEELAGGWMDGIHADDRPRVRTTLAAALAAREPFQHEYRLRRHDGEHRWIIESGLPRYSPGGDFDGYVASAIEVHDLRAAEQQRQRLAAEVARERERLQSLIASIPGVVWESWGEPDSASQRVDFVSEHVQRILGYTVEEWLAVPNFGLTIVHPDDRERAVRTAAEHFAAGGIATNDFRWIAKDGRVLYVESHSAVITDEAGRPLGMRGVTMDVTARRRAEESLRFLARASEVLTSSLDYETTLKAAVQLAVPALGDLCALDLFDQTGAVRRLATAHADPARQPPADSLLGAQPDVHVAQALQTRKPIVTHDAGSSLVVPMEARGRVLGAISFSSAEPGRYDADAVELATLLARRAAIAVDNAQLYRAAVDASSAKDEFLATISHELRTPMTATLGWIRMLNIGAVDADMHRTAMEAIERSTLAQAKLIDDILDVSSIILGKFRMESRPVDLPAVIRAAIETLGPATEAKNIKLDIDLSGWSGAVQGDAGRLQQVVWNLVSNAMKFGRRDGRIEVRLDRVDSMARLTVRDDGAGIDPRFLPYVFDRFRQADTSMSRTHSGMGLGLAIVRHLVELHGGTVRAESDGVGRGATFTVELPAG
jgi:PAS domain S-box-containing protein